MKEHKCVAYADGTIQFVYDDMVRSLIDHAQEAAICRVSHVNAGPDCLFRADLSPIGGPVSPPFKLRQDALDWEIAWVNTHYLK